MTLGLRKFVFATFAVALMSSSLAAQEFSLRRAIDLALTHGTAMAIATADQMHAYESYREARSAYVPQVTVGSGLAYAVGFPLSLEGSAPTIFNVSAQSLVLNFAQREFIRAARSEWKATDLQGKDQRGQVVLDTVSSYAELDKWQRKLQVLRDQEQVSLKIEAAVAERVKEGIDSSLDQTKARLTNAQVRYAIAQAEGAADLLRTHLAQLTGLPIHSIVPVANSIPTMPPVIQEEDVVQRAQQSSPAIQAADQRVIARQFNAKGQHRALYPAVDFATQYGLISATFTNFEQFFVRNTFQNQNVTFGLVIRFPFFNFTQRAVAQAADADTIHARKEAQNVRDQVSLDTLKLQRAVEQLAAAREVAQLQYDLYKADLESAQARNQSGVGTLHDLQSANLAADQRAGELLDAQFELQRAQLQLMRATGELETWLQR